MNKYYCLIILLVGLACKTPTEEAPLSRAQFVEALISFSYNEGLFSGTYNLDSISSVILADRNATTLKKLNITKEDFITTYRYYDQHKELLIEVYRQALDSIDDRKSRLDKVK